MIFQFLVLAPFHIAPHSPQNVISNLNNKVFLKRQIRLCHSCDNPLVTTLRTNLEPFSCLQVLHDCTLAVSLTTVHPLDPCSLCSLIGFPVGPYMPLWACLRSFALAVLSAQNLFLQQFNADSTIYPLPCSEMPHLLRPLSKISISTPHPSLFFITAFMAFLFTCLQYLHNSICLQYLPQGQGLCFVICRIPHTQNDAWHKICAEFIFVK